MQRHTICLRTLVPFLCSAVLAGSLWTAQAQQEFLGRWALTIPGGGAGWLGVTHHHGFYDASILWGGGSVVPVSSVFFQDGTMYVTRTHRVRRKDATGKVVRTQLFTDLISARVYGNDLELTLFRPHDNGVGISQDQFTGHRIPPVPPAPDLSQVKYGPPIRLFDGEDLAGWRLAEPKAVNGWSVQDGVLINRPVQAKGEPHKYYGNLRTDRVFKDFNLSLEVNVPKHGNSGVYLRGIYEVQVADTYGEPVDSHNMGAIYSRITPSVAAERPAGQWQTLNITLVQRHVTVVLNGTKIIDNQPLLGCTGGALWSDESRPGPIYLQGDHLAVDYRNIVLRPVISE